MKAFEELVQHAGARLGFLACRLPDSFRLQVRRLLVYADWPFTAEEYLGFCIACGLCAGFTVLAFSVVSPSLLFFTLFSAACFYAPVMVLRHAVYWRAKALEWEACFELRRMAAELEAGVCFEECLENAAGKSVLGREFGRIVAAVSAGVSIPEALQRFASRTNAFFLKKLAAQLAFVYSHGGSSGVLRQTAEEHVSLLRMRLKEYNSRLAFYSLAFIACAVLIPAVFLVYASVGGVMAAPVSENTLYAAYFAGFPLLSLVVLVLAFSRRP